MAFYPLLIGHLEVRVDRRDPRPAHRTDFGFDVYSSRRSGRRQER